ncbi:hypothetical protein MLD38_033150 [Melastoma candidum]|uniref:Uncharacterized protein n=1 Tax=Melastoma candidum TaxID=119954 RepID=A0ACB9MA58_9MYRT|nr:hypothetical protein MLD38_033150 [Melastoma candidum]
MNDGSLSFWLDRRSGKKCYMISSKALSIETDQDEARKWISIPQSRFPVVLEEARSVVLVSMLSVAEELRQAAEETLAKAELVESQMET